MSDSLACQVFVARKRYKKVKDSYQKGRSTLEEADDARREYKHLKGKLNRAMKDGADGSTATAPAKKTRKARDPNRARSEAEKATDNILKGRQDRARELKAADPALKHKEAIATAWAEYRAAKAPAAEK